MAPTTPPELELLRRRWRALDMSPNATHAEQCAAVGRMLEAENAWFEQAWPSIRLPGDAPGKNGCVSWREVNRPSPAQRAARRQGRA